MVVVAPSLNRCAMGGAWRGECAMGGAWGGGGGAMGGGGNPAAELEVCLGVVVVVVVVGKGW